MYYRRVSESVEMTLHTHKEGPWIIFDIDGRTAKYNLSTHATIGFSGRAVRSLDSQLGPIGISEVINSFDDPVYQAFLRRVQRAMGVCRIGKASTLFKRLADYGWLEQYVVAGIGDIAFADKVPLPDVPKPLVQFIRDRDSDFILSNRLIEDYKNAPDVFNTIMRYQGRLSWYQKDWILRDRRCVLDTQGSRFRLEHYVSMCVKNLGYNASSLVRYIDFLVNQEALALGAISQNLWDYQRMMVQIGVKWDRYPRHLLSTHAITIRNYERQKKQYDAQQFATKVCPWMECTIGEYQFICPKTPDDIKAEAAQQHNCVASYIDDVIQGRCVIMFMRYKAEPDKSLVTIEVNPDLLVVQALQRYNAPLNEEQKQVIKEWRSSLPRRFAEYNKKEKAS